MGRAKINLEKKLRVRKTWEISRKIGFKWHLAREWEHRQHKQHSPRQASDPASPNSSVSKPLPVVLLKQLSNQKIAGTPGKSNVQIGRTKKILEKKLRVRKTWEIFRKIGFKWHLAREWEHRQHKQHSPRQASDPASPNSSVSKPLPVVLLKQLSNQKIAGTPGKSNVQIGRTKKILEKKLRVRKTWEISRKIGFKWHLAREWEHRQHKQHSPRQASDPASPNSSVSKPLPVVLLKQLSNQKIAGTPGKSNVQIGRTKKILEKKLRVRKTWEISRKIGFKWHLAREWEHRQHKQHSPRQASDPASPNSSVSKPLPVVLLKQLSNQKIAGTPGKSNVQIGRTKKILEKKLRVRKTWEISRKIGFKWHLAREWEHRQHKQHSPRQASDPASPNSSVSKPLPVVLLKQLSNQKIAGTPGKSNVQIGRTKKILEKKLRVRKTWEISRKIGFKWHLAREWEHRQHKQHSPRQASDPASPNSSVSKPLPVVLLKQLSNQKIAGTPGKSNVQIGRTKKILEKKLRVRKTWEISRKIGFKWHLAREWEHRQHKQHSPRQASDPASPNSSVSKPLPVVLLKQLSNQKIAGTPGKSNVQIGRTKKILEKKLRVRKTWEISRKIGFKWHLAREWEHRQHKQHSPRQASDPASPNSSVSKPLPVVLLKQLSNQKIAGTPGKSNVQIGRTKKILEKKLRVRKTWEISRKIGFKWHLAREWEHRQHKQHSPRQASDPASPNSSVSKPLPVVLLKQLSNQKIAGTPGKSNVQIGRTKKILEKKLRVRKTWEISRKIGFKWHLAKEWEHRQHKQHSPRQASDPASPNSSVSKPLPVVLLKQLSNQKIAGTPGKSNVQIGRTKKILEKKLRVRKTWEISRKIGFKWHLAREWEHRQHKQHSPRQASDPASPNSSVSKPLPVVLLKQLSNQKIAGTPGKSNVQIGRTKKILEKKLRVRKTWEISRKIGFKWHPARECWDNVFTTFHPGMHIRLWKCRTVYRCKSWAAWVTQQVGQTGHLVHPLWWIFYQYYMFIWFWYDTVAMCKVSVP